MSILGDVFHDLFGADTRAEDRKAAEALAKSTGAWDGLAAPVLKAPEVSSYVDLGAYTPTQVSGPEKVSFNIDPAAQALAAQAGPSAFGNIATDPRLQDAQYQSLGALDEIIKGGGLSAQDQAALSRIQSDVGQADRGRREAILQNLGARGMGGSGQELLAQLSSSQAATDRANQSGLDIAGMGQQRSLDAILNRSNMAGGMQAQDFGQQAQAASAQDIIGRFNAGNTQQTALANMGAQNDINAKRAAGKLGAQQFNVNAGQQNKMFNANAATDAAKFGAANAQGISNLNTEAINNQAQAKAALPQQNFMNRTAIASGKQGAALPAVGYYQGLGDRKAQESAGYLDALIKGGSAAATAGKK